MYYLCILPNQAHKCNEYCAWDFLFTPPGGLSKTEIATLTDTQIDEILASHITLIPSSVFSVSNPFLHAQVSFQSIHHTWFTLSFYLCLVYISLSVQGFTATQLRNLSPAQAQASTTTQRSTLSASQISALEAAAGVSYTSSSGGI